MVFCGGGRQPGHWRARHRSFKSHESCVLNRASDLVFQPQTIVEVSVTLTAVITVIRDPEF